VPDRKVLVVASLVDEASMNIASALLDLYGLEPTGRELEDQPVYARGNVLLAFTRADTVNSSHVPAALASEGLEAVIIASRHSSQAGKACLSTHTPGNLGPEAPLGGKPMQLAWSDPGRQVKALKTLARARDELGLLDYAVCLEVTHHGPTEVKVPVLFVEIGSTPERWADREAARAVAEAIWEAAARPLRAVKNAVGFGGGHYAPKFTALMLEDVGLAVGHIVPKYAFKAYGPSRWLAEEPVRRTWGGCEAVVLDKKGLRGSDRRFVASVAEELGLEVLVI